MAELEALVGGGLTRERARAVVRHLLRGCGACLSLVAPHAAELLDVAAAFRAASAASTAVLAEAAAAPDPAALTAPAALTPCSTSPAPEAREALEAVPAAVPASPASSADLAGIAGTAGTAGIAASSTPGDRAAAAAGGRGTAGTRLAQLARLVSAFASGAPAARAAAPPPPQECYDRAIDRALGAVMRHGERAARAGVRAQETVAALGPEALEALAALPEKAALPEELQSFAAYEALLERSWTSRREQPRQMVRLAELAVMVAEGLGAEGFSAGQVHDFQARAAAELANAYRVVERAQEAQASLDAARRHFGLGSQDKLLGARILEVEASLRGDRDEFDAAFAALDGALRIYRRYGDAHLVGRCLIKKGMYTAHSGRQREAIELLNAGLEMVDAEADPPLALSAVHNTAYCLAETGRFREARSLLWRHQALYAQHAGSQVLLRLSWLQAQIYANLNDLERAELALEEARRGFHAAGKPHSEAFTLAELAGLKLRRGQEEKARLLALEAATVFIHLDVNPEAARAMMPVQAQLKWREGRTSDLVHEVVRLLRDTAPAEPAALFARSA